MRQVEVHTVISAPREAIFDLVADLAARPAFTDHYLTDFRLARADPYGVGAAARFRLGPSATREWGEIEIVEADRPRRIVERVRIGRLGRSEGLAVYELIPEAGGSTRVELTTWNEPATARDRLRQRGAAGWIKRQSKMALERLRLVFEDPPAGTLARVSVAGYDSANSARFGTSTGSSPGVAGVAERAG